MFVWVPLPDQKMVWVPFLVVKDGLVPLPDQKMVWVPLSVLKDGLGTPPRPPILTYPRILSYLAYRDILQYIRYIQFAYPNECRVHTLNE